MEGGVVVVVCIVVFRGEKGWGGGGGGGGHLCIFHLRHYAIVVFERDLQQCPKRPISFTQPCIMIIICLRTCSKHRYASVSVSRTSPDRLNGFIGTSPGRYSRVLVTLIRPVTLARLINCLELTRYNTAREDNVGC